MDTKFPYQDILYKPYEKSTRHAHMSLQDRAAQFSPFAALTGHEEAIEETARLTDMQVVLDEVQIAAINEKLYEISRHLKEKGQISITYFVPDEKKSGGTYLTVTDAVKKLDETQEVVLMQNGVKIPMKDIIRIEELEEENEV